MDGWLPKSSVSGANGKPWVAARQRASSTTQPAGAAADHSRHNRDLPIPSSPVISTLPRLSGGRRGQLRIQRGPLLRPADKGKAGGHTEGARRRATRPGGCFRLEGGRIERARQDRGPQRLGFGQRLDPNFARQDAAQHIILVQRLTPRARRAWASIRARTGAPAGCRQPTRGARSATERQSLVCAWAAISAAHKRQDGLRQAFTLGGQPQLEFGCLDQGKAIEELPV